MKLNEPQARLIVLAQAIEGADTQGKLLSDAERDQIDSRVAREALGAGGPDADTGPLLARRAELVLDTVRGRNRMLASLQATPYLQQAMSWALPLGALILGVVIDRVFNPRRVDLLSEPFLGVLAWNLVVYLLLVLSMFRRREPQAAASSGVLRRWIDGAPLWRRWRSALGAEIAALFFERWHAMTAALGGQRLRHMMHLAAAAWGAGVALSLIFRGTVRAYTVGWESTLLNTEQVHFILQALSWPLVRTLGMEPFTVEDIARLQFEVGAGAKGDDGSRWLWLYVGLLLMLVVLPRLALAAAAAWRERQLARQVGIDLGEPYFQRIIDNLMPANVRLGVLAHQAADQIALEQVLLQERRADRGGSRPASRKLIDSARGDALWLVEFTTRSVAGQTPLPGAGVQGYGTRGHLQAWRGWFREKPPAPIEPAPEATVDVMLHVVSQAQDLAAALPLLQSLRCPVVMLVRPGRGSDGTEDGLLEHCRRHQRSHDLAMDVLAFDDFAPCWVLERSLLNAVARRMPRAKTRGSARLIAAWDQRNRMRFSAAMTAIAVSLEYSARQTEEIPGLPLLDRARTEKRRAHEALRKAAMETVRARVRQRDAELVLELLALHGLEAGAADDQAFQPDEGKYAVQVAVSAPQAAMGGAATGAAMGASIDLMTGGMTLGAAAALGALAGGSTALIGAIWNNRSAPSGGIRVSFSDEMLLALAQACLLRYLAVIHLQREHSEADARQRQEVWEREAFTEMQTHRKPMLTLIEASRRGDEMREALAGFVEQMARDVLLRLYPAAQIGQVSSR